MYLAWICVCTRGYVCTPWWVNTLVCTHCICAYIWMCVHLGLCTRAYVYTLVGIHVDGYVSLVGVQYCIFGYICTPWWVYTSGCVCTPWLVYMWVDKSPWSVYNTVYLDISAHLGGCKHLDVCVHLGWCTMYMWVDMCPWSVYNTVYVDMSVHLGGCRHLAHPVYMCICLYTLVGVHTRGYVEDVAQWNSTTNVIATHHSADQRD